MKYIVDGYRAKITASSDTHRRVRTPYFSAGVFDTFEQARSHLEARYVRKIKDAEKYIAYARRALKKISAMKEPENGKAIGK